MELTRVTKLTLHDNDLRGTPLNDSFGVGQRKLKQLDLSGNRIEGKRHSFCHVFTHVNVLLHSGLKLYEIDAFN